MAKRRKQKRFFMKKKNSVILFVLSLMVFIGAFVMLVYMNK